MLNVVILNVVMLSVVMLGVVALTLPNSVSDRGGTNKTNRGGLAPSSQTVGGSLLRIPWPAKPGRKMD